MKLRWLVNVLGDVGCGRFGLLPGGDIAMTVFHMTLVELAVLGMRYGADCEIDSFVSLCEGNCWVHRKLAVAGSSGKGQHKVEGNKDFDMTVGFERVRQPFRDL